MTTERFMTFAALNEPDLDEFESLDFEYFLHRITLDDGHIYYLDYALTNNKMSDAVVDVTLWHINADEPSLIDYGLTYKQEAQDALFAPDVYRLSDHDPVIVTLSFQVVKYYFLPLIVN